VIIDYANLCFTGLFTFEILVKIIAWGKSFWKDGWNIFGLIIVCFSITGTVLSSRTGLNFGGATNIIRTIRAFRIFRIIKKANNLKIIFNTFVKSIPSLLNIGCLFFVLLYIYSVIGVYLFAELQMTGVLTETKNFQSFSNAFTVLLMISTGEQWNTVMHSTAQEFSILHQCIESPTYYHYVRNGFKTIGCGSNLYSFSFFYSYYITVQLIFVCLFIAIMLDAYNEALIEDKGVINENAITNFKEVWSIYDQEATGFLKEEDLQEFLTLVGKPLGFTKKERESQQKQENFIRNLCLITYNDDQDYQFNEVLQALALKVTLE